LQRLHAARNVDAVLRLIETTWPAAEDETEQKALLEGSDRRSVQAAAQGLHGEERGGTRGGGGWHTTTISQRSQAVAAVDTLELLGTRWLPAVASPSTPPSVRTETMSTDRAVDAQAAISNASAPNSLTSSSSSKNSSTYHVSAAAAALALDPALATRCQVSVNLFVTHLWYTQL
jgi:hypothetical protein